MGAVNLRVLYGYSVKSTTDEILGDAIETMIIFNKTSPGVFLVDALPFRQSIPIILISSYCV